MAMKVWVQNLVGTIVLVSAIAAFYTIPFFNRSDIFGFLSREQLVIILLVIYLIMILIPLIRKVQYVSLSVDNDNFVLKYYNLGLFPGGKKNIYFPVREFHDFRIIKSFFNLREGFVVRRKMKKGIAAYPEVSVTGLNSEQKEALYAILGKLTG